MWSFRVAVKEDDSIIILRAGINGDKRLIRTSPTMSEIALYFRDMTPESRPYSSSSMVLLPRLAKQVMRRSSSDLLGMDMRLLLALSYLGDHDGAPQQELVDALCIDAKNVVLVLNELEGRGHLVRRRDAEDRRRHRVYITREGRQALEQAARAQENIEDEVLQALDAQERATLWSLLARALQGAERDASEAAAPALASSGS
jgi:DNA-binding MarR family transcriptional regulator